MANVLVASSTSLVLDAYMICPFMIIVMSLDVCNMYVLDLTQNRICATKKLRLHRIRMDTFCLFFLTVVHPLAFIHF